MGACLPTPQRRHIRTPALHQVQPTRTQWPHLTLQATPLRNRHLLLSRRQVLRPLSEALWYRVTRSRRALERPLWMARVMETREHWPRVRPGPPQESTVGQWPLTVNLGTSRSRIVIPWMREI